MRSHRRPMRKPIPAVFPSVGSCRLCTNLFLFFIFTFSLAGVISRAPVVPGPPRIFYFSPSVPHYGGCALTDALCAGLSLPSSRASAPADFAQFYFCFSILLFSLAKVVSRSPAVLGNPRRLLPTLASPSRTCLLCWLPRGLHRATSDNCR